MHGSCCSTAETKARRAGGTGEEAAGSGYGQVECPPPTLGRGFPVQFPPGSVAQFSAGVPLRQPCVLWWGMESKRAVPLTQGPCPVQGHRPGMPRHHHCMLPALAGFWAPGLHSHGTWWPGLRRAHGLLRHRWLCGCWLAVRLFYGGHSELYIQLQLDSWQLPTLCPSLT